MDDVEQLDRAALDGRIQRAASEEGGELVLSGWGRDAVSFDAAELAAALGAGGEAARALTKLYVFANGKHRWLAAIALVAKDRGAVTPDPAVALRPPADFARHVLPPAVVLLPRAPRNKTAGGPAS